jgi:hypothetical protein
MLEDQPMRYLRAAGMIARDPRQLRAQLRQLLGDTPDTRTHAEQARADALAEMAAATSATACPDDAAGADEPRADPDPSRLVLRTGTVADVPELVALHTRCSLTPSTVATTRRGRGLDHEWPQNPPARRRHQPGALRG